MTGGQINGIILRFEVINSLCIFRIDFNCSMPSVSFWSESFSWALFSLILVSFFDFGGQILVRDNKQARFLGFGRYILVWNEREFEFPEMETQQAYILLWDGECNNVLLKIFIFLFYYYYFKMWSYKFHVQGENRLQLFDALCKCLI